MKKNGRVVTQATRDLFDKRAKEYSKRLPTAERRKRWNKVIRDACTNDYRRWVSNWVETIEKADHKGDTKAIYSGVKALSGAKRTISKRPTMREVDPASCTGPDEQRTAKMVDTEIRASDAKSVTQKKCRASPETTNENAESGESEPIASKMTDAVTKSPKPVTEKKRSKVRISCPEELVGV